MSVCVCVCVCVIVYTGDAYEREARLLRELRDQAQDEAARTKVALKDIQVCDTHTHTHTQTNKVTWLRRHTTTHMRVCVCLRTQYACVLRQDSCMQRTAAPCVCVCV